MDQLSTTLSRSYERVVENDSAVAFFNEVIRRAHNHPLLAQRTANCSRDNLGSKLTNAMDTLIKYAVGNMTEEQFEQRASQFVDGTPPRVDLEICLAWQACLLQVVEEFDERFTNDIKQAWTDILAPGISRLTI